MGLEAWGTGRWVLLLAVTFFVGIFLAIGIFFRLSADIYAVSEATRSTLAMLLGGIVVLAWLLLAGSSVMPQLRTGAFLLLIGAFLANMAVPSFLPTTPTPPGGSDS